MNIEKYLAEEIELENSQFIDNFRLEEIYQLEIQEDQSQITKSEEKRKNK